MDNQELTAGEWIQQGDRWLQQKQFSAAIESYERAIERQPRSAPAYCKVGNAWLRQGEWHKAEHYFRRSLEFSPTSHLGNYGLGQVAAGREQWQDAVVWFQKTVELQPGFLAAVYADLAGALEHLQRWDEAIAAYGAVLQLNPDGKGIYEKLGMVLCQRAIQEQPDGDRSTAAAT